jgi:hypothetical protein
MTDMNANRKRSLALAIILIALGIVALLSGTKSLIVLIPAASLVWYGAMPSLRSGRR